MTIEEHMLMLNLLFKQRQGMRVLLNMLRSRGVLTEDDEKAFASAQIQDVLSNAAVFDETKEFYLKSAHSLGILTGLENMPEPPLAWFEPPKSQRNPAALSLLNY
jgi:hypothetical protein